MKNAEQKYKLGVNEIADFFDRREVPLNKTLEELAEAISGMCNDAYADGYAEACKSHEGTAEYRLGFERGRLSVLNAAPKEGE